MRNDCSRSRSFDGSRQVGRLERRRPVLPGFELLHDAADIRFAAVQATHAAEQMRKAFQIARLFQLPTAHDGRKPRDFRARLAVARDQPRQAFDHLLVQCRARIDAIGAHRAKQRVSDRVDAFALLDWIFECNVHLDLPPKPSLPPRSSARSGSRWER
jgi:hypothetical protein